MNFNLSKIVSSKDSIFDDIFDKYTGYYIFNLKIIGWVYE